MESVISRLWFTIWESVISTIFSLFVGIFLGLFLSRSLRSRHQSWFETTMTLPVFLPGVIVASGFITLLGNNGVLNKMLMSLGVEPIKFLYNSGAIILAHIYYNIPLVYLVMRLRLMSLGEHLQEMGQVLGASKWDIFRTITFPRIKSAVVGVGLLVFIYCWMSFNIPLVLGGIRFQTVEVYIYTLITQKLDWDKAFIIVLTQLLILIIPGIILVRYIRQYAENRIANYLPRSQKSSLSAFLLQALTVFIVFLPLLSVAMEGFKTGSFQQILQGDFFNSLWYTFFLATVTTIFAIGFTVMVVMRNESFFGQLIMMLLVLSPVTVSFLVLVFLGQSIWSLILTFTIALLPPLYYIVWSRWYTRPDAFIEMLKLMGAGRVDITLASINYLRPAIIKSAAVGYALVLSDVAISSVLSSPDRPTAMVLGVRMLGSYRFGLASVAMTSVLALLFFVVGSIYFFSNLYDTRRC